jgi:periplasmic protein TonB
MELKKNESHDLERKSPMFFSAGLVIALLLTTVAFEWKSAYDPIIIKPHEEIFEAIYTPKITIIKVPEIPKPTAKASAKPISNQPPVIIAAEDEVELVKALETAPIEIVELPGEFIEAPIVEVPDIFSGPVETYPEFPGGINAFYAYIGKNLKYPTRAKNIDVQGRVFVEFVINTDGSITDVRVIKGIGAGCDEAAKLVIENSPNFSPAKQRGVPVRYRQIIPIVFALN